MFVNYSVARKHSLASSNPHFKSIGGNMPSFRYAGQMPDSELQKHGDINFDVKQVQ